MKIVSKLTSNCCQKMKLLLKIILVGSLTQGNIATTTVSPFSIFHTNFKYIAGALEGVTSNAAHAVCQIAADHVRQNPLKAPRIERVSFQLRTPCGQREFRVSEAGRLRSVPEFDEYKKTVVFVTGWLTNPDQDYIEDMARAYHCRGGHNFLVVNSGGIISTLYVNAAYNVALLGKYIAIGLRNLGIPVGSIHLVGHSLGAHVGSSAGRYYYKQTGEKLLRITGLDPARPCFVTPLVFPRLSRGDANFVDIIHSNPGALGTEESIGHVDFYAAGLDVIKPGCSSTSLLCSHEISIRYYLESVYPNSEKNFVGSRCASFVDLQYKRCSGPPAFMGYASNARVRGIYFFGIRSKSPYGLNAKNIDASRNYNCGRCLK